MKQTLFLSVLIAFVALGPVLLAHGGEDHKKNTKIESVQEERESSKKAAPSLSLDEFATLHPMVVHFPIVLLLFAPVLWFAAFILDERNVYRIAFVTGLFGLIAALVAGTLVHPHTTELPAAAQAALDAHDFWAEWTIRSAIASLILMGGGLWSPRYLKLLRVLALLAAAFAALSVSVTGHYGAYLTHVEGVGPQGRYLEAGDSHEH